VPASGGIGSLGVSVGDVGGGDDGESLPVGEPDEDAELLDAGAEGDVLFDGECVGVGDFRALVVGLGERVAFGYSGAVPRLVPDE
jgi:hypothetical protein